MVKFAPTYIKYTAAKTFNQLIIKTKKHMSQEVINSQVAHIKSLIKSAKKAGLKVYINIPDRMN